LVNLGLLALGSFLFAASFPNPLFAGGGALLAWLAYVPVFVLIRRVSLRTAALWGALYGYSAYSLFNYWLGAFHPLAGLFVGILYLLWFTFLFPLLKLALIFFPRRGYLLQWLIWLAYEYLRTLGFLGYSYGITGYSQWSFLPVIQIADLFGVWAVSALVVFSSAYIAQGLTSVEVRGFLAGIRREWLPGLLWTCALIASLVYGLVMTRDYANRDYSPEETARIALIQSNESPWADGVVAYREKFRVLRRLSGEALEAEPQPDLVVWPETAFAPRIYWHLHYRDDYDSYEMVELVKELSAYMEVQEVPFLIGNDDGRKEVNAAGQWERVDYNAAIFFTPGKEPEIYRKMHLVPFTEHFPYKDRFPGFYQYLLAANTHQWTAGKEALIFEQGRLRFATPICFEDTFGDLPREFVLGGANFLANISNDAWSGTLSCQMQHLGMAVFRAVENRRSLVRATATGQTCGIGPDGRIIAMAEPFTETVLALDIPLLEEQSLYTRLGDILGQIFVILALIILFSGAAWRIIKSIKERRTA
jgi:apolipoprotein N-acyltransferase